MKPEVKNIFLFFLLYSFRYLVKQDFGPTCQERPCPRPSPRLPASLCPPTRHCGAPFPQPLIRPRLYSPRHPTADPTDGALDTRPSARPAPRGHRAPGYTRSHGAHRGAAWGAYGEEEEEEHEQHPQ